LVTCASCELSFVNGVLGYSLIYSTFRDSRRVFFALFGPSCDNRVMQKIREFE